MSTETLVSVQPAHKGLAFILNKTYKEGLSADALHDITRGVWYHPPHADASLQYAFATYKSVVLEVYTIEGWQKAGTTPYTTRHIHQTPNLHKRWEFVGTVAPDAIRDLYVGKKIEIERSYGSPFVVVGHA